MPATGIVGFCIPEAKNNVFTSVCLECRFRCTRDLADGPVFLQGGPLVVILLLRVLLRVRSCTLFGN